MTHPHAMPIGFTYDGEALYPAAPAPVGTPQPLAVLASGETVWPAPSGLVAPGQPQPFGVLASGAYVWAVEQPPPPPAPRRPRRRTVVIAVAVAAVVAAGTGVAALSARDRPVAVSPLAEPVDLAPPAAPAGPPAPPPAAPPAQEAASVDFEMPDLIGTDLQQAQDQVQELGVFFSRSHDLLGDRSQVVDSGWRVCAQTPAAGSRVRGSAADWEGRIDFGVVRLSEQCP